MTGRLTCGLLAAGAVFAAFAGPDPKTLTKEKWTDEVRPQVLRFFEEEVYGALPPKPAKLEFELAEYGYAFKGLARRRQYIVHAEDAKGKLDFNVLVYLPMEFRLPKERRGIGGIPVLVYPNFCGNWTLTDDPKVFEYKGYNYPDMLHKRRGSRPDRVSIEEIMRRGYGFATFCFNEVYPDDYSRDVTADSVWGIFDPAALPEEKLAHPAWTWGSMRVRDLIAQMPEIDQSKVAIVGQSRMGKNAINTGVHDDRYALTCANCGGTKSLRHLPNLMCPYWFSKKLTKYVQTDLTSLPVETLEKLSARFPLPPYDQWDYIACIAPRAVVISTATGDKVSRPEGSRALFERCNPYFELFGKTLGWHIKEGKHSITHEDWRWFMDYADTTLGWLKSPLPAAASSDGVARAASAPTLDGKLDDALWSQVKWQGGFQRFRKPRQASREVANGTEFAIAADDENLYLGVKARHASVKSALNASGGIWAQEAVEFYFAPSGRAFDYYQFLVTLTGVKYAMFYSEGGQIRPDPFGPEWEFRTAVADDGWTAEARIPLAAFYMTRTAAWKTEWKVNVGRTCVQPGGRELSCWADGKGYADLESFRSLPGFPRRRKAEDVAVSGVTADVTGPRGGKIEGRLKISVTAAEGGAFTLGTSFSEDRKVTLAEGETTLEVPATFPANGRHPAVVTLRREGDRTALVRTYPVIVDYRPIRLHLAKPAYRGNFYPGQDSDTVAGEVVAAVGDAVRVTLTGPGFAAREAKLPAGGGTFSFDTRGFAEGTAQLVVEAGGERFERKVRKLGHPEGIRHVSWIEDGHLVVDGKPVLRRNLYGEYYRGGKAFDRKFDADDLRDTRWLKRCATLEPARMVKGIEQKEATKDVRPCAEIFAEADRRIAEALKGDGAYYYISDEPECRQVSPVYLRHLYEYVCEKDPYHVVLSCSRAGERYIDCADWFETHPYINAHFDETGRRVYGRAFNTMGGFIDAFRPDAHPDKCVGGTATCFSYSGGTYPTFDEYQLNAWAEFVRGAKSLFPYAYHDLGDRAALYEGTRYLFSSAEALQDLLLFGRRETLVKTPDCEVCLWTAPDGERMFAALNFTTEGRLVDVKGLRGRFREFRGSRVFDGGESGTVELQLAPHESLVATERPHGADLPTAAETRARIERLEGERTARGSQLLGRRADISISTSSRSNGCRKMFDGVRDVWAWGDVGKRTKFIELSFEKISPAFASLSVYGDGLDGVKVLCDEGKGFAEVVPTSVQKADFVRTLAFGRTLRPGKLRLEFPAGRVELYEIEL